MKKIISFILVALMAIPFAALGVIGASALTVPAEPQSMPVSVMPPWYIYYSNTAESGIKSDNANSGTSADQAFATWAGLMPNLEYTGGTVIIPGKGYIGVDYEFKKCEGPVTITAFDEKNNVRYQGTLEVAPEKAGDAYGNGTQYGMFMIFSNKVCGFNGDYIFDKIDIIERTETGALGKPFSHTGTSVMSVNAGAKLVIKDTCKILKMTDAPEAMILNVNAGGYAYLHTAGFGKYTGEGIIVMDKAVYESDLVKDEMFADFKGAVVDENGNVLRGTAPAETEPAPETTKAPEASKAPETTKAPAATTKAPAATTKAPADSKAPETTAAAPVEDGGINPIVWVICGVAAVAVVVVVVVVVSKKKKAE